MHGIVVAADDNIAEGSIHLRQAKTETHD